MFSQTCIILSTEGGGGVGAPPPPSHQETPPPPPPPDQHAPPPPPLPHYGQAPIGTHPTGMHSCFNLICAKIKLFLRPSLYQL